MRARQKYIAIKRAEWRLKQRLATIDHEFDVIKPGLQALERHIVQVGELPSFSVTEDDGDRKD